MQNIFIPLTLVLTALLTFSANAEPFRGNHHTANIQTNTHNDKQKLNKILAHYDQWEGVSYKLGGNSRKGIDCSAYMQRVFAD